MNTIIKNSIVLILIFLFGETVTFAQPANTSSSVTQLPQSTFFSKEKWGASYSNYMNGPTFAEGKGGSINHYLTLKRKFGSSWALSGVFRPDSNLGNEAKSTTMGDSYLRLDYPTMYEKDGVSIKGNLRYLAPMSEESKKSKINGVISPYIQAKRTAGKFDSTYMLIPKIYLNTITEDQQKLASHGHWLAAGYKTSRFVTVDFALYPVWTYKRGADVEFNDLPAYPGVTLNFSEDFSVSPYVEVPLLNAKSETMSVGGSLSYNFL